MSVPAAILLLIGGIVGVAGSWNAARPILDPTRRYSPSWLPAMVVTELAPMWLLGHGGVLGVGLLLDGDAHTVGRIGAWLLVLSAALGVWVMARTALAVHHLRKLVEGRPRSPGGRASVTGWSSSPPGVVEQFGVAWEEGLTLDLIRPAGGHPRSPVVVYVHGGGWTGGDPQRQARDLYHELALAGWVTMAIRYPFAPDATVEQQVEVVRRAVRWARAGLPEHGVDATHVVLAGGSAGGHLATMAALTAESDGDRVAGCVAMYAIFDLANRNRTRAPWRMIRDTVMRATVADAPDRYAAMSPLDRITDESPAMLVVHGGRDTLVPIGEAEQFVAALHGRGRPVDLVRVPGAQHAFDAFTAPTSLAVAAAIRTWLTANVLEQVGER